MTEERTELTVDALQEQLDEAEAIFDRIEAKRAEYEEQQKHTRTLASFQLKPPPELRALFQELDDAGYEWAMSEPALAETIRTNPGRMARPKAPTPAQSEKVKALSQDQARELLDVARWHATQGIVGKRDLALLLFYAATGWRRSEVVKLKWGDVHINGGLYVRRTRKGGKTRVDEVKDQRVKTALLDYLRASERFGHLEDGDPLWTAHDRTGDHTGKPLTSHAVAKRFKKLAQLAGIPDFHLHMLRHTDAREVHERGGINAAQEFLDHRNQATTRVYTEALRVKKDQHSEELLDWWGA